jgi:hypothetical protein
MNENLKDQDVLLVKEKGSNELHVANADKDGKLKSAKLKEGENPDFLKIDKHGNVLENFFANFKRQVKDPTRFEFFRVPMDKFNEVIQKLQEAFKNPETPKNKELLDMHRVNPEDFAKTQAQAQGQQKEQTLSDASQNTYAINPDLVDWQKFERYGITREGLEKSGNFDKLLDYQKTDLLPVAIKFDEETLRSDAKFSLRKQEDGTFTPAVHLIRHQPELERPYFGVQLTDEDKKNLLSSGNLGRVVEAEFKKGEKTPVYLSLDKQTNELVACRFSNVTVPEKYKGVTLSEEQRQGLSRGEKVEVKGMISTKGKQFDGAVQFNADKRYFELIFDNSQRQSRSRQQNQSREQNPNKEQDTSSNKLRIPNKLLGVDLSEKQQGNLRAGQTVYVSGMKDKQGQDFNAYVKINTEKNKLDFFKWNPDKAKKQGAEVTPDNAHKTQVAKNNDGKTTEANKQMNEPMKSGQTQPTEKQAEKQAAKQEQEQPKKSKGRKM